MKAIATTLLILGICGVGLSFLLSDTARPTISSTEEVEAFEADAMAAHNELESPSDEQLELQRQAQERIVERTEAAKKGARSRAFLKKALRFGGCVVALIGIGLFGQTRQA